MHWKNINPEVVAMQRRVMIKLGYEIDQQLADRKAHADWLQEQLEGAPEDAILLFLDIDAFPTNRDVVERAFAAAEAGRIFGVAQTANHVPKRNVIYAAPSFLAVSKRTWLQLGKPSMRANAELDAGMGLSLAAFEQRVPVDILGVSFVCVPRWPLADKGAVGIGTFYDQGSVFHLFQSRTERGYREALAHVAQSVIDSKPIDYLGLFERLNSNDIKFLRWRTRQGQLWSRFVRKYILGKPVSKARQSEDERAAKQQPEPALE